jgi:hypothetical protein
MIKAKTTSSDRQGDSHLSAEGNVAVGQKITLLLETMGSAKEPAAPTSTEVSPKANLTPPRTPEPVQKQPEDLVGVAPAAVDHNPFKIDVESQLAELWSFGALIDEEPREHEDNELEVVERMKAFNDNILNDTGTNMVDDEFDDTDEGMLHNVKAFLRAAVESNKM